jgi:hypothetical protein
MTTSISAAPAAARFGKEEQKKEGKEGGGEGVDKKKQVMMEEVDLNENKAKVKVSETVVEEDEEAELEAVKPQYDEGGGGGGPEEYPIDSPLAPRCPSFSLTQRPLKQYLTREVLPHVDHYRNRMSFIRGKMMLQYLDAAR